jgi:hypothetical protein
MAFPLLALLLLAAEPASTAPVSAGAAPLPAADAPVDKDYLPKGAPADDYGFVAWCGGVLSGHMDIAERVKDVLPLDDAQQTIGKAYLRAYDKALAASKDGKTAEGKARAAAMRKVGWDNWNQARAADKQLAADTYLAWQLPGRCEHAAARLSGDPDLFKKAFSPAELDAVRAEAPRVAEVAAMSAPAPAEPAAAPAAQAAPESSEPVFTSLVKAPALSSGLAASDGAAVPVSLTTLPSSAEPLAAAPAALSVAKPAPEPEAPLQLADAGGATPLEAEPAPAVEAPKAAPAATVAEAAKPAPKPEVKKVSAPAAEPDTKKGIVKMPKKGHLLPGFLRKKDS